MSHPPKRTSSTTPPFGTPVPIAEWQDGVARSRERVARLGTAGDAQGGGDDAMRELAVTFEELSVAEEELRAQNEQLEQAYNKLVEEREGYHALFQRAPIAYLVTDANGTIVKANLAASLLLGSRADRLVGKPLAVFIDEGSRRRFRSLVNMVVGGHMDTVTTSLQVLPRRVGPLRVEATIGAGHNGDGVINEIRWLLVDQTQRLRREQSDRERAAELETIVAARTADLEQAQQLKDHLIATVSHEFRTALGAIGGYAELLSMGLRGPMSGEQLADLDRIHHAYKHLARLVDDLLSYNKIAAGRSALEVDDVSLADTLRGIEDLVAPQASARGIVVEMADVPAETIVRADPERVKQIMLNLLGNAVKFTDVNGRVSLSTYLRGHQAFIDVTDTGPGIPPEKLDVVFEPFVRLRAGEGSNGFGLGLAISRELARAMGGDLTVTSELGIGSRFTLCLPLSTRLANRTSTD
jgi:PAS domain S-box-containing protein